MADISERQLQRGIQDARSQGGMQAGLPKVAIPLDHAERLLALLEQVRSDRDRLQNALKALVQDAGPSDTEAVTEAKVALLDSGAHPGPGPAAPTYRPVPKGTGDDVSG